MAGRIVDSGDDGQVVFSIARLPLIEMRFRGGLTVDGYRRALDELLEIVTSHTPPFITLLDLRDFNPLRINAKMRKEGAAVWKENRDLWLRACVAEARIVSNPIVRGMLTAFDWLTSAEKDKWPCRHFGDVRSAEEWLYAELAKYPNGRPFRPSVAPRP